jgi:hypothetical protein
MSTTFTEQIYPLGQPGALGADEYFIWNTSSALTVQFVSGLAVKSLWFPAPQGPMSFYNGPTATGTPFYTTDGSVPELVSVPNNAPIVTISGPGLTIVDVYASSIAYAPFRAAAAPYFNIAVMAPIVNTGTGQSPVIGLATPLAIAYGGSGTASPGLIAGSNIIISGSWPNQTIAANLGAGGIQSITVNPPLSSTGGQNPTLSLQNPLLQIYGGSGTANPYLEGDASGVLVNGSTSVQDNTFQWVVSLGGFLTDNAGSAVTGGPAQLTATGGITVTQGVGGGKKINLNTTALIPVTGGITSTGGSVVVTPHAGSQSVNLETSSPPVPIYSPGGTQLTTNPHIVRSSGGAFSITWSNNTLGTTTITLSGAAAFSSGSSYAVAFMVQGVTGGSPPIFVLEATSLTGGGFSVTGDGNGGSGSGNITFDIICIGQ